MSSGYASQLASTGGPSVPATPHHCPFCGDEDLRPVEDDATAWSCRSCARVFTVALVRVDYAAIPAHRPHQDPDQHRSEPQADTHSDEHSDQKGADR